MLVITREIGQAIVIGQNIKITVLGSGGGQVRLGTDAPSDVLIHREELLVSVAVSSATSAEFDFS